jgi:predicted  nucleic acid-binding Zn-ribbon protein
MTIAEIKHEIYITEEAINELESDLDGLLNTLANLQEEEYNDL